MTDKILLKGLLLLNWIDGLERKYKRFAIKGLIRYLVIGTAFVFAVMLLGGRNGEVVIEKLSLDISRIKNWEVWRLVTFIFIPPTKSIFIVFVLYLLYMFGNSLERYWGSFRLTLYYLIGMLSAIAAAIITKGTGSSQFLNLSIFMAFAYLYPNFELLLFFILPVKVKYLAWLNVVFILFSIAFSSLGIKIAAVMSFMNFFVFFGKDIWDKWVSPHIRNFKKKQKRKKFKVIAPQKPKSIEFVLKCSKCGKTSKEHPELIFAYCPRCGSDYVYCQEHLNNHDHRTLS